MRLSTSSFNFYATSFFWGDEQSALNIPSWLARILGSDDEKFGSVAFSLSYPRCRAGQYTNSIRKWVSSEVLAIFHLHGYLSESLIFYFSSSMKWPFGSSPGSSFRSRSAWEENTSFSRIHLFCIRLFGIHLSVFTVDFCPY